MGYSQHRRIEEHIAREVVLALFLLGLAMIQATLLPRPLDFPPNLLLGIIICQSLLAGPANASRWAFYAGLSLDICADSWLGSHVLALLAALLLPSLLLAPLSRSNWLLPLAGVLLGALSYHGVELAALSLLQPASLEIQAYLFVVLIPSVLVVLVPALPLFLLMRWIEIRRRGEVPVDVY